MNIFTNKLNHFSEAKQNGAIHEDEYANISPFKLNGKGKLFINSNICYFYEDEKFCSILGRKSLMGKILENISLSNNSPAFSFSSSE